ncbi:arabinogalactan peptide 13-like [Carica papaya]|uniref:arabinogalactan peptide 13-like n=1 Tax=Carica papaya TaxID=3649 RepID=UPI000B8D1210|nr:arabinogalactan peptide 13-like [Carica papaya]
MEAMKMKLFVALMVAVVAFSAVQKAAAADAPAPTPASDAALFVPTFFASLGALALGFLF